MIRIAVTGPESTGKSTLTKSLASFYKCPFVPEYAREYLQNLHRPYVYEDVEMIALHQMKIEDEIIKTNADLLVSDTELIVIKIWMQHRFDHLPEWLENQIQERKYDLYLLCKTDIEWTYDPLREHPQLRDYFYQKYRSELDQYGFNYIEVEGNYEDRFQMASHHVNLFLRE